MSRPTPLARLPIALALTLLLAGLAESASGQSLADARVGAAADSTARVGVARAAPDSAPSAPNAPAARAARSPWSPRVFYGATALALVGTAVLRADPDTGGYRDGWRTFASFPDKAIHFGAAWALTTLGLDLDVSPRRAALFVCAAGAGYEVAQGYVSPYDIAADCAGAAGAALWRSWRDRSKRRAARP